MGRSLFPILGDRTLSDLKKNANSVTIICPLCPSCLFRPLYDDDDDDDGDDDDDHHQ